MTSAANTFQARWNAFFSTRTHNRALRLVLFAIAVYGITFAIAMARTAQLGTSPIAAIPNVMSYVCYPITIGQFQILMNLLMVIAEVILNKSLNRPIEFFQMIPVFFFGMFTDFNVWLLQGLPVGNYGLACAWTVLSIIILGLSVTLELFADAVMMPGEGIVVSIANVSKQPFPRCKVGFDVANVVTGAIISFAAFGGLVGVREGTVATAIFTGPVVKMWTRALEPLKAWIPEKSENV